MVGGADADGAHQTILDTTQTILDRTQTILDREMDNSGSGNVLFSTGKWMVKLYISDR